MPDANQVLREQLLMRLKGRGAHMPFEDAVNDFPLDRINERFPNGTYSSWGLVEHLRIAQHDILDYIRNPDYRHMQWPKDYWPDETTTASAEDWQATIEAFLSDRGELEAMVEDPETDLYAEIPWGNGHTVLRELLIVSDHNAYHIGELAIMRQVMGTWGNR
jgi:hypothetical protein